ncbi:MAG: hypothetical protein JRC93_09925 [Deltaproteobacteria bacterium]|nr:hypothetical protein [Deltaproteobacteria bacterium]
MDNYTKLILSVIAICLIAITIKLWEPVSPAYGAFMDKGPTHGDLLNPKKLEGAAWKKERARLIKNIPLVKVYGSVDCD